MKKYVELTSFKLDKSSAAALHLQLADELLKQLRALPPNENYILPSERTLVKQFEINRLTVHRAYTYLLENGLVVKNPDKSLSVSRTARKQLQGAFPVIGIILPEKFSAYSKRPIAMEYLRGIIDRATELEVSTMMLTPPPPGSPDDVIADFIETRCAKLSGIIHLGDRGMVDDNVLEKILGYTGVPQIFISGYSDKPHIGSICADVTPGIMELCAELKKHNVKKIGIISRFARTNPYFIYNYIFRTQEAQEIFEKNGFEISFVHTFKSLDEVKIDLNQLPDAIWCYNDEFAKNLITQLNRDNIRVPQDVIVTGFDGFEPEFAGNKIATVFQNFYEIGCSSIDLAL